MVALKALRYIWRVPLRFFVYVILGSLIFINNFRLYILRAPSVVLLKGDETKKVAIKYIT